MKGDDENMTTKRKKIKRGRETPPVVSSHLKLANTQERTSHKLLVVLQNNQINCDKSQKKENKLLISKSVLLSKNRYGDSTHTFTQGTYYTLLQVTGNIFLKQQGK